MEKFNAKNLVVIFFGVLLIGLIGVVCAQQALPKGGDSFETAVELEPGSYEGGSLESKEVEYFYITGIESGQEINVKGTFTAANLDIGTEVFLSFYDEDEKKLAEEVKGTYEEPALITISQLHTGKDTDKYYIEVGSNIFDASYSLDISLKEKPAEEETVPPAGEGWPPPGAEEGAPEEGPNWGLILGIIAAVVVIAIIVYFLLKKKKE